MMTPYKYVIAIILAATLAGALFWLGRSTAVPKYTYDWCGVSSGSIGTVRGYTPICHHAAAQ